MKKNISLIFFLIGISAALIFLKMSQKKSEFKYRTVKVYRGDLFLTILTTGTVLPQNRVEIKAPVAGRMEHILVKEGDRLVKGQIIAWMSSLERAAILDSARGQGLEEYEKWSQLFLATPIIAPISGTLILRSVEPGQTFTVTDSIFSMSDRLTVKAQVDETDIAKIKLLTTAKIILDAYPDTIIEAVVDQIAFDAKIINNVTSYLVDVVPKSVPTFMRSGMTANVIFEFEVRKNVLLIPSEAIRIEGASTMTSLLVDNEVVEFREIKIGGSDGKRTEVVAGLKEGDILVLPEVDTSSDKNRNNSRNPFFPMGGSHGPRR